jgi:adenylate cyclase
VDHPGAHDTVENIAAVPRLLTVLEAEGIYDPDAPNASDRFWVLNQILRRGGSLEEIREAHARHRLPSLMIELMLADTERFTLRELARRARVPLALARRMWRAFGFSDPPSGERRFTERDVPVMAAFAEFIDIIGEEATLQTARAIGTAMARIAEAEVATIRSMMEAPLRVELIPEAEVWASLEELLTSRLHVIEQQFVSLHRHQIVDIARRYEEWDVEVSRHNVADLTVGFADIVGFTELTETLDLPQLDRMLTRFESATSDAVAAAGATLVKRLGDAVMFVTPAVAVACRIGLALVEVFSDDPVVPPVRVGLAAGDVMALRGDYYGRPVNRAARVAASAAPSTVLVTGDIRTRILGATEEFRFSPAPITELQGVGEQVQLWQLVPSRRRRRARR